MTAYGSVMNAMRAQGGMSDDKTRILKDLRAIFHINDDRHKAEARRVANDEKLTTIADVICGYETYRDWAKEGRRAVPLLPRGYAETALIKVADALTQRIAEENGKLPYPVETERDRSQDELVPFIEEKKIEVMEMKSDLQQLSDVAAAISAQQQLMQAADDSFDSSWSRKRRSSIENMTLNQQLYPNVMKAQMGGKKGAKRQRKEKKQKVTAPPLFPKIDFEESINRIQEKERNQGFNRIIHSYASAPAVPQHFSPGQAQMNVISEAYRYQQQQSPNSMPMNILPRQQQQIQGSSSTLLSPVDQQQQLYQQNQQSSAISMTTMSYPSPHQQDNAQQHTPPLSNHQQQHHHHMVPLPPSSVSMSSSVVSTMPTPTQTQSQQNSNKIIDKPEPKVQILSNQPVKLISPLSLKTLQARGNVKVVQSPPGKVVLRPLSDQADAKVTQIKGMATSVAGAKLNVQLMPLQNKPRPNFLIVKPGDTVPGSCGTSGGGSVGATVTTPSKSFPVQIVNTNGESKATTLMRSISTPTSTGNLPTLKLDAAQLQKIRIVPAKGQTSGTITVAASSSTTTNAGNKVIFTTSSNVKIPTTQIKISKNSKLYPIAYNNGAPAPIVIEKKPTSTPTTPIIVKATTFSHPHQQQQQQQQHIHSNDGLHASNSSLGEH